MPAFVVTPDHYPDHEPGTAILGVDAEPQAPAHLIPQAADGEWDEETLEELAARIQEAHVAVRAPLPPSWHLRSRPADSSSRLERACRWARGGRGWSATANSASGLHRITCGSPAPSTRD